MVKVYSITTCPWCEKVKKYLKSKNVEFEEHNIERIGQGGKVLQIFFFSIVAAVLSAAACKDLRQRLAALGGETGQITVVIIGIVAFA